MVDVRPTIGQTPAMELVAFFVVLAATGGAAERELFRRTEAECKTAPNYEQCRERVIAAMHAEAAAAEKAKAEAAAAAEKATREEHETQATAREQLLADVESKAKKMGFRSVDFDNGIYQTLVQVSQGERQMPSPKLDLFGLADFDSLFRALQVLDQNNVIFAFHVEPQTVVWLVNYKKRGGKKMTWMNDSPLTASEFGYFRIVGTKTYRTVLGPRQAVVIEPVF